MFSDFIVKISLKDVQKLTFETRTTVSTKFSLFEDSYTFLV